VEGDNTVAKTDGYWLYRQLKSENDDWDPTFAMQSCINWMRSLEYEMLCEHGDTAKDQLASCRAHFAGNTKPSTRNPDLAGVFGPLFQSLTNCVSLQSLCEVGPAAPWMFPTAIFTWYYAAYSAFRSVLSACHLPTNTHAAAIRQLNGAHVAPRLPHPLNMIGRHAKVQDYITCLPAYRGARSCLISNAFAQNRNTARGVLLSYLRGTCKWEVDRKKEHLKKQLWFRNFRGREAKADLQRTLPESINFLNCAVRYRGKANYRDSIYLTYGRDDVRLNSDYLQALASVACFCFIVGLTFMEDRSGRRHVRDFLGDVRAHLRGRSHLTGRTREWFDGLA